MSSGCTERVKLHRLYKKRRSKEKKEQKQQKQQQQSGVKENFPLEKRSGIKLPLSAQMM